MQYGCRGAVNLSTAASRFNCGGQGIEQEKKKKEKKERDNVTCGMSSTEYYCASPILVPEASLCLPGTSVPTEGCPPLYEAFLRILSGVEYHALFLFSFTVVVSGSSGSSGSWPRGLVAFGKQKKKRAWLCCCWR